MYMPAQYVIMGIQNYKVFLNMLILRMIPMEQKNIVCTFIVNILSDCIMTVVDFFWPNKCEMQQ